MAGVSHKDLSEILPTSLLPGYGEKVCSLLLLLCGVVLKKTNHTWLPLKYKNLIKNDKKGIGNKGSIEYDGWIEQVIFYDFVFHLKLLLHFVYFMFLNQLYLIYRVSY